MAEVNVVGADLANLQIMEEEDEPLVLNGDAVSTDLNYELCLVGRLLIESIVNFSLLKNTMADLWHPLQGVSITEMEDRRILFRFYSEVDLKLVVDGMPWFFNRHLIVFHRVQRREIPSAIPLWTTVFWVQVHNLPSGFFIEGMARQLRNFIGMFYEYDAALITKGVTKYMRIRVLLDVQSPLKRKKKICTGRNQCIYVLFQYEKLPLFCFLCGRLGHGENFCPIRLTLKRRARRYTKKLIEWRRDDEMGMLKERGVDAKLEDMAIDYMDGKKRQRHNTEGSSTDISWGPVEEGLNNTLSAAAFKQANQAQ
ncbi:hypothetical protein PVK06_019340 [Gossypium arboreum]|uniref:CCHC-type domain-containing protein n=1 Tax=Gossypium arboreum TaxID=29729 RepID=A0ABR0PJR3_GOSAR|nr:hypothetical protein PVK06_019340 [Gossypium arboreum]